MLIWVGNINLMGTVQVMCVSLSYTLPFCHTEGSDYAAVTRELTFTSTIVNIPVTVQTVADTEVEGTETFTAELSVDNSLFPNVNLDPDTSEVFILDDDGTYT